MVLECPFYNLLQEVWGHHFVNMCTRKDKCKWLMKQWGLNQLEHRCLHLQGYPCWYHNYPTMHHCVSQGHLVRVQYVHMNADMLAHPLPKPEPCNLGQTTTITHNWVALTWSGPSLLILATNNKWPRHLTFTSPVLTVIAVRSENIYQVPGDLVWSPLVLPGIFSRVR